MNILISICIRLSALIGVRLVILSVCVINLVYVSYVSTHTKLIALFNEVEAFFLVTEVEFRLLDF